MIGIRLSRKKSETLSSQEATDSLEATEGVSQDSTVSLDSQGVPKNGNVKNRQMEEVSLWQTSP